MIEALPMYVYLIFTTTILLSIWLFYKATQSRLFTSCIITWIALQTLLVQNGFYSDTSSIPPHSMLLISPWIILVLLLFLTGKGRKIIESFNEKWLTWLHIVRIPVELVLFWLSIYKLVPDTMTFEGRNFDILSGLSAPFIAYFGYHKKIIRKNYLLFWNVICLTLVLNVVITGLLSLPSPFQQMSFDRPNTGVLYFPFTFLPGLIVPLVILAHLTCIRKLLSIKN